ncbi:MAG: antibiotic biosynthesis monooxygenase [Pseudomonadales bacterium]|nr:antibiotic biosynthesis monooxygenase [Pseudomonadales bacterium]
MFVVANRVPVLPDWAEAFETRFRKRAGEIEKQPGFVRMQILKPCAEGLPYVVLTTWQDEAAFNAWIKSEDFALAHQNPMPKEAFAGKPVMERHEVVIASGN